jgi:hypothetical protein
MGYKVRGYTRDTPEDLVRDYKLFAISCEGGKREPDYFKIFQHLSNKIKVDVIQDYVSDDEMLQKHKNDSAPKWVLDRALRYIEKNDLKSEDDLWFVIDKDRWSDAQLRELFTYCNNYPNWNLVISNPCFEVWLYFHKKKNITLSISKSCNELKNEISKFTKEGYNAHRFIINLEDAINNAKARDSDPNHFVPKDKETKVYQLGDAILKKVSSKDFDVFISTILPKLIDEETKKIRKQKKALVKRLTRKTK